jgi:hypothetical protein
LPKLTRYYITKSGDEPTLRSVKVAPGAIESDEKSIPTSALTSAAAVANQEMPPQSEDARVGRLVKNAIRRRSTKP